MTRSCHNEHPHQRKLLYNSVLPWSHTATSGILRAEGVNGTANVIQYRRFQAAHFEKSTAQT